MSKWISGQQLINDFEIEAFELFEDYIRKGLQPYNALGKPISPLSLFEKIVNIPWLKEQHQEKRNSEAELGNDELKKFDATIGYDLIAQIDYYEKWTLSVRDLDWNKFELPEIEADARAVLNELVHSLYHIDDIKRFFGVPDFDIEQKEIIPELPKAKALRPDQKAKLEVQRIAKELYDKYPEYHSEIDSYRKIYQREDVQNAGAKYYKLETVQKWISKVAPGWAKNPGIRSKDK